MDTNLPFFRPFTNTIKGYSLFENQGAEVVRLHQNEGTPWDTSTLTAMKGFFEDAGKHKGCHSYPNLKPRNLIQAAANFYGVESSEICATSGSSQALSLLALASFAPGVQVALPDPTFSLYRELITSHGATAIDIPLNTNFQYPEDSLFNPMVNQANILILCSPNNPTGCVVPKRWIADLACQNPNRLIIVDEAYVEFSDHWLPEPNNETSSCIDLVKKYPNILVLRTLSKAWSAAGLRIGFAIGNPNLIDVIKKLTPPYSLSYHSEICATFLLLHKKEAMIQKVNEAVAGRKLAYEALNAIEDIMVFPSQANFLLFRTPRAAHLHRYLAAKNILIRSYCSTQESDDSSSNQLEGHLRFSIGTHDQLQVLIQNLKEYFK